MPKRSLIIGYKMVKVDNHQPWQSAGLQLKLFVPYQAV